MSDVAVLSPRRSAAKPNVVAVLLATLTFASYTTATVFRDGVWTALACGAAGFALGALMWLGNRRARFMFDGEVLRYRGLLGTRIIARRGEGRVVRVDVSFAGSPERFPYAVWLDEQGRARLALSERPWDQERLDALIRPLGLPEETVSEVVSAGELRDRYPGSVPWALAYPRTAAILLIAVITAVCFAFGWT